MKLDITVWSTVYDTTYEAVANDPDNEGMSEEDLLFLQGQNQDAGSETIDPDTEFEIEKDQEGQVEGLVNDDGSQQSEQQLEGEYHIGDTLKPGTYFFDGKSIIGRQKREEQKAD